MAHTLRMPVVHTAKTVTRSARRASTTKRIKQILTSLIHLRNPVNFLLNPIGV